MYTILGAVRRLWFVVLVLLIGTAFGATQSFESTSSEYEVSGAIAIVPSETLARYILRVNTPGAKIERITDGQGVNPFLQVGGGQALAGLLQEILAGEAPSLKAVSYGPQLKPVTGSAVRDDSTLSVTYDDISRPSYLSVTISSKNAETAKRGFATLVTESDERLKDVQAAAGVGSSLYYVAVVGAPASTPKKSDTNRIKSAVGVAAAGLVLTALLVTSLDAIWSRTRRRRSGAVRSQP